MSLLHLQEQNGKGHLFILSTQWGDIPFKLPSLHRSRQYLAALALAEDEGVVALIQEVIFRECVVDDTIAFEEPDMPGGIVPSVSNYILELSAATGDTLQYTEQLFDTFRRQNSNTYKMMRTICSVFSGYKFSDLEELDYQDLCELFIQAEQTMMEFGMIDEPFQFNTQQAGDPSIPGSVKGGFDLDSLIADGRNMEKEVGGPASEMNYSESRQMAKNEAMKKVLQRKNQEQRRR